ncbi:Pyruvate kinase [Chlamydiales bacterium STE3]|nr:Pyruvate kinase [Chlamydiales bacterium STE3]
MMRSKTKIICTIGPTVGTLDKIIELIQAGMNVARLNFSHGTHEEHRATISLLKEARAKLGVSLAIMLDTKGPEIRLGKIENGSVELLPEQKWILSKEKFIGNEKKVTITPENILDGLTEGAKILFDDGYISSKVVGILPEGVEVQIENGGIIRSGKGVTIPDAAVNLPCITNTDVSDIVFGCKEDVDIIAASFVKSADDVMGIKKILINEKKPEILVMAKIENKEGVLNFDSIVQVADGIMIARGDLGVQINLSQVPKLQKMMIRKSYLAGKPVVTATQMLESMINNPRPTRAEASDVANAIYDGTSAVMLSGETAIGKYPIGVVHVMKSIVDETEADFNYREFFNQYAPLVYHDVPSAVTLATVKTSYSSNAQAIFAFTNSGNTARLLSRLRPAMPIIAMTSKEKCYHQLSLLWGVIPYMSSHCTKIAEAFDIISTFALDHQIVGHGDLVVVTAGSPFGISGTTNMMMVESIGDVLVRAHIGFGERVHGNVTLVMSPDTKKPYEVRSCILVMTKCDESYTHLIRECTGVILENHIDDVQSEKFALKICKSLNKPVAVRADAASHILKEGQLITLLPEKALVYKGVIL